MKILFVVTVTFLYRVLEKLLKLNADIIFCFDCWSSLIKKKSLNLAKIGVPTYHPSSLPQNRGKNSFIWALVLGLKQSASTFFFIQECINYGDILTQREFEILYEDDTNV